MIYKSNSPKDTKNIAGEIANKYLNQFRIFTLEGDLGAGKTTFTQGFADYLGIKEKVISPTFVIIREHPTKLNKTLYHIDLYRVKEAINLGIEELFDDPSSIVIIEWPEKIAHLLPKEIVKIKIRSIGENSREIVVE